MGALTAENRLRIAWIAGLAAAVAVIAAQFMDYTGFEIGTGGTSSANEVAPRPVEFRAGVGGDQLWLGLPIGLAVLFSLRVARSGQWRLGRTVAFAGLLMLVLTFAVLLRNGTDGEAGVEAGVGEPAVAYLGAEEKLLGGFWVQLAGSAGLIGAGAGMVRWRPAEAPAERGRRRNRPGVAT